MWAMDRHGNNFHELKASSMNRRRIVGSFPLIIVASLGCNEHPGIHEATTNTFIDVERRITLSVPGGADFRATAVAVSGTLQVGDRAQLSTISGGFGLVSNTGTASSDFGVSSVVGDITSIAPVTLRDRAQVHGSVVSGGTVTRSNGVTITGTTTANAALGAPDVVSWRIPFPQSSQDIVLPPSQSANLPPGAYSHVTAYSSSRLSLRSGVYFMDALDLEPQSVLALDETAGPIIIYVQSGLIHRGTVVGGAADMFLMAYLGTTPVAIESSFRGTLVAPSASIRFGVGGTTHSGTIFAKDLQLDPDVHFTFVPFSGWDGISFDVTPHFQCVESRPDGSHIAMFGYANPNKKTSVVPVGTQNQFLPSPADRRQPTAFLAGTATSSFAVAYTATLPRWSLNGTDATVDQTRTCPSSFQLRATADTTIKAEQPAANFGADAELSVTSGHFAMVTFDRSALLAARGTARFVTSAHLQLTVKTGTSSAVAHPMLHTWSEGSATWNCASDQNAAATAERCLVADRWAMPLRADSWGNPYDSQASASAAATSSQLSFDVTEDVQRFLSTDDGTVPVSWVIQPQGDGALGLGSREGGQPAVLVVETVTFSDGDFTGVAPFAFVVDASLATSDQLPAFADGVPRPLAVLGTSDGQTLRYAENELVIMSDSAGELAAIEARWNATEVARPLVSIPGVPTPHVLRIDTSKANPSTLVASLRRTVNRPDGLQSISSDAGLRLLAAAAEEQTRGTVVGVNWVVQSGAVTTTGFINQKFEDGSPSPSASPTEDSSNSYDWNYFSPAMHNVNEAWKLMYFAGKLKRVIRAAIIDTGFSNTFQDETSYTQFGCASGSCRNPFKCGGGALCPWHGVHVTSAGFGEPNNGFGGAGPGAEVTALTLDWGFGDMASLLVEIPALMLDGQQIINISAAIPVPDYLFFTTVPAELVLGVARSTGTLIFAISGNSNTNVDARRCFNLVVTTICPWEKEEWFPCESSGVDCVGGTNYSDKKRASFSNFGGSVRYYASGTVLSGADPDTAIGNEFQLETGTSFSSPFIAGTAALTWAANSSQSASDVEHCLSAARSGGPDGRFVDTFLSASCGLGNPGNLPPLVKITNPPGDSNFGAIGLISLTAEASDYESGTVSQIFWSSDVEGNLGSTTSAGTLLYQPSGKGIRKITASATDASGATGHDTVTLAFNPAPPIVRVIDPATDGAQVILGLPTDLIAKVTNLSGLGAEQPCGTAFWKGFQANSILFDHLAGCSTQFTFLNPGTVQVNALMTVDGLQGTGTRTLSVISDGKLHVKIRSPQRDTDLNAHLQLDTPVTLSAASTEDGVDTVTYTWSIFQVIGNSLSVPVVTPGATLTGQSVNFTMPDPGCGSNITLRIKVVAVDSLGSSSSDQIDALLFDECPPT